MNWSDRQAILAKRYKEKPIKKKVIPSYRDTTPYSIPVPTDINITRKEVVKRDLKQIRNYTNKVPRKGYKGRGCK